MATVGIPQPSEQARTYARAALEAFKRASEERRAAAPIEPSRLPDAEREKFWALAYDAMFVLQAQAAETQPRVAVEQITAEAFWWGWRLNIPHSQVEPFLDGTEAIATIVEVGLHVVPEVGELIALAVKGYVLLYRGLILAVDTGNGVYLNQTWLNTPGLVFIPTTR